MLILNAETWLVLLNPLTQVGSLLTILVVLSSGFAQSPAQTPSVTQPQSNVQRSGEQTKLPDQSKPQTNAQTSAPATSNGERVLDTEAIEVQQRAFAVSLITTLANEARSFKSKLSPRVLARAADALWDADEITARSIFRRAWEAAEKADSEDDLPANSKNSPPAMVLALRKISGSDLRSEVLNLAARRDRTLADEFLAKLAEAEAARKQEKGTSETASDAWATSDEASKRLRLAHKLLDENQADRAFEVAAPVLNQVNEKSISFLSKLRSHGRPDLADRRFLMLLAGAESDPASDANTVSGLSSYAFTPGLYITFSDGGVRWTPAFEAINPPSLSPVLLNAFFRVAGAILLRPSPPSDQDLTSAGRQGKYLVIKRLLPLFEQHAPNTAVALRSQLATLGEGGSRSPIIENHSLLSEGIKRETPNSILDNLQERLDKAKTQRERDAIYADAAAMLAARGDRRAQELADKIDNTQRREMVRAYVDLALIRVALAKKDTASAARFAKSESLSRLHRTWAYVQIARLLMQSDRAVAQEILEQALNEARRVEANDTRRANMMLGIAYQFVSADNVRPWEVAAEAIKEANALEEFSGEDIGLNVPLVTGSGLKMIELDTAGFDITSLIRMLAKQDFTRANDLAKSFSSDGPRAVATLAAAKVALEKPRK